MPVKKTVCLKSDFPLLQHHHDLVYLDNAATTQKPQMVLDALMQFYTMHNANIHRGVYDLAEQATAQYEKARATVASFINADPCEIVFTKGTTESINLAAYSWAQKYLLQGDEIVVTQLEHHANLLPWYDVAKKVGAIMRLVPVDAQGTIDAETICSYINYKTKLVALTATSHVTGAHLPLADVIERAHQVGARVLVDAAQAIAHQQIDVQKVKADFLVFSGHKMCGPTGIGVLYATRDVHDQMLPYQWGGGMVRSVVLPDNIVLQSMPHRLEAGTPPIAQAIGLAAAVNYLQQFDRDVMQQHEQSLCRVFVEGIMSIPRVHIVGSIKELMHEGHLVSFYIDDIHAHDVAFYLGQQSIAVRAGNHCAQPLIDALGTKPLIRVSFFWYNTKPDIDKGIHVLKKLVEDF